MKKLIALVCAIALMATMCAFSVSAADGVTLTVDTAAEAVVESEIVVAVKATGALGLFQMELNYDTEAFTYNADSFVTTAAAVALKEATDGKLLIECQNTVGADFADAVVFEATFTALDAEAFKAIIGDAAYLEKEFSVTIPFDADINENVFYNKMGLAYASEDITINNANVKVTLPPAAPVASNVVIAGEAVVGAELTATWDYTDINGDEQAATKVVWYADDEAIAEDTVDAAPATYTLTADECGKVITVGITPANAAEKGDEGAEVVSEEATAIVVPEEGYAPVATIVDMPEEFIATLEYTVEVEIEKYDALEDATTYAWYLADAADASVEGLEAVSTELTVSFGAENRDQYAILVVTPVVTLGDVEYEGEVVKAAALIKGEPPVIDTTDVDVAKTLRAGSSVKLVEGKDFVATSKAPEGQSQELDLAYAWYLATADEFAEFNPEGKDVVSDTNSYKMTSDDIGKYVIVYITATDALDISTTEVVKFEQAISKKSGGASYDPGRGDSLASGDNDKNKVDEDKKDDQTVVAGIEKFTDVPADKYAWAVDGIDALVKAGIIVGVTETTFEPETKTTRAHFVAMVMRAVDGIDENAKATYADVAADYWGYKEIASAQALGALGIFGDSFEPEKVITREEMASVLYEVAKAMEIELKATETATEFSDAASIADAAKTAVAELQKAGILHGMGDGTFMPKGETTRAQAAKVVHLLWTLA